ncbi:MAG: hypothetical protein II867_03255, partial [Clostridia bacterium]|nr:hypothetical protein [Clostridia bacterium]
RTTNDRNTSGITINFYGTAPTIDLNFGWVVGKKYALARTEYNSKYSSAPESDIAANQAGIAFDSEGKVIVSTEGYALIDFAYPDWEGDTYKWVGGTFDYDDRNADNNFTGDVDGKYLKLGDFNLFASIYGLNATVNKEFSCGTAQETMMRDEYDNDISDQFVKFAEAHFGLDLSIGVSIYGSGKAGDANIIDLSEILDLVLGLVAPNSAISGSTLRLNIVNELGYNNRDFVVLNIKAYISNNNFNLTDPSQPKFNIQAAIELVLNRSEADGGPKVLLGLYLDQDTAYADLSEILGESAKIAISNLGINKMVAELLSGLVQGDLTDALTSGADEIAEISETMMDIPYVLLRVNPQLIMLQINADVINAVYKKIMALRGREQKNLIPDIGDLMLYSHTRGTYNLRELVSEPANYVANGGEYYNRVYTVDANGDYWKDSNNEYVNRAILKPPTTYETSGGKYYVMSYTQAADGKYWKNDGTYLSMNLRFSDGFYACLSIPKIKVTKSNPGIIDNLAKSRGLTKPANPSAAGTYYKYVGVGYVSTDVLPAPAGTTVTYVYNDEDGFVEAGMSGDYWLSSTPFAEATALADREYVYDGESKGYQLALTADASKGGLIGGAELEVVLENIGLELGLNITMTSNNPTRGTDDYDKSIFGWLENTLGSLLSGVDAVGKYETAGANYTGKKYKLDYAPSASGSYYKYNGQYYHMLRTPSNGSADYFANPYVAKSSLAAPSDYEGDFYKYDSGTGMYLKDDNGAYWKIEPLAQTYVEDEEGTYKFTSSTFAFSFTARPIEIFINLKANINLKAILQYGIGGILFSDIALEVSMGEPIDDTFMKIYYLGSSRLKQDPTGNLGHLLASGDTGVYSDAIYIDLTGMGLGKIKFQGLAGLLGVKTGAAAGATTSSDCATAAEGTTAADEAAEAAALFLEIALENGRTSVTFDKGLLDFALGLLNLDLPFELPPLQSVDLSLISDGGNLNEINLNALLDSVGTAANIKIKPITLGFGEKFLDTADLIGE